MHALWWWGCKPNQRKRGDAIKPTTEAECTDSFKSRNTSGALVSIFEPAVLDKGHRPLIGPSKSPTKEQLRRMLGQFYDDAPHLMGHVVGFLRHPVERVASGYAHGFHDCSKKRLLIGYKGLSFDANPWDVPQRLEEELVLKYAACVEGCAPPYNRPFLSATPCFLW